MPTNILILPHSEVVWVCLLGIEIQLCGGATIRFTTLFTLIPSLITQMRWTRARPLIRTASAMVPNTGRWSRVMTMNVPSSGFIWRVSVLKLRQKANGSVRNAGSFLSIFISVTAFSSLPPIFLLLSSDIFPRSLTSNSIQIPFTSFSLSLYHFIFILHSSSFPSQPFWSAAPKGRCPVGHGVNFQTSVRTSICPPPSRVCQYAKHQSLRT